MSSEPTNNDAVPPNLISLAIALFQNFSRDWTWGVWSVNDWDFLFQPTRTDYGPNGQWGPQFLYGSLAAIAATLISAGICKASGKEIPVKDMMASLVGTMAAIIPWNAGQNLGIFIGQSLGWSQINSAFAASAFTGIFEGSTQFLMIKITSKLCDAEERRKFCQDPKQYLTNLFDPETLKQFTKEFGFSITIGAIPGAIWQLVFTACGVAGMSAVPTGLLIALAVGLANFGVAKIQEKRFAPQTNFFLPTRATPINVEFDFDFDNDETPRLTFI